MTISLLVTGIRAPVVYATDRNDYPLHQIQHDNGWWRHVKPSFESAGQTFFQLVRIQLHGCRDTIDEVGNNGNNTGVETTYET